MAEHDLLASEFEQHRARLRAVAERMLGARDEADDALQEAWLRISRAGTDGVENLGAWLTTVVGRVCLDVLRSRNARREDPIASDELEPALDGHRSTTTPEDDAVLADSIGVAMNAVLERLPPAERVAFVLHDMFDLTFDEIGPIVGRSAVATRQLASRARRKVRGAPAAPAPDRDQHRRIAEAFLAASRNADFEGLLAVLDPDVVIRGDEAAVRLGGQPGLRGARDVAKLFSGRAQAAKVAFINDAVGLMVAPKGKLLLVLTLAFDGDRITEIEAVADKASLGELDLKLADQ